MHDYKWEETDKIKQLQIELEALKLSFEMLKLSPKIEENFRRIALLKVLSFRTDRRVF